MLSHQRSHVLLLQSTLITMTTKSLPTAKPIMQMWIAWQSATTYMASVMRARRIPAGRTHGAAILNLASVRTEQWTPSNSTLSKIPSIKQIIMLSVQPLSVYAFRPIISVMMSMATNTWFRGTKKTQTMTITIALMIVTVLLGNALDVIEKDVKASAVRTRTSPVMISATQISMHNYFRLSSSTIKTLITTLSTTLKMIRPSSIRALSHQRTHVTRVHASTMAFARLVGLMQFAPVQLGSVATYARWRPAQTDHAKTPVHVKLGMERLCALVLPIGLDRLVRWKIHVQSRLVKTEVVVLEQWIPPVTHVPAQLGTLVTLVKHLLVRATRAKMEVPVQSQSILMM